MSARKSRAAASSLHYLPRLGRLASPGQVVAPTLSRRRAVESKLALLADTNPGAFCLIAAIIEGALSAGTTPPLGEWLH